MVRSMGEASWSDRIADRTRSEPDPNRLASILDLVSLWYPSRPCFGLRGRSWRCDESARQAENPPPVRVMLQLAKPAYCLRGTQGSNPCPSANLSRSLVGGDLRPPATRDVGRDSGSERQLMACGPLRFRLDRCSYVLGPRGRFTSAVWHSLTPAFGTDCRGPSAPPPDFAEAPEERRRARRSTT